MLIPMIALLIGALILCFGVYCRIRESSDAESGKIYTISAAAASAIYLVVAL